MATNSTLSVFGCIWSSNRNELTTVSLNTPPKATEDTFVWFVEFTPSARSSGERGREVPENNEQTPGRADTESSGLAVCLRPSSAAVTSAWKQLLPLGVVNSGGSTADLCSRSSKESEAAAEGTDISF